jgi:hypothetical protein
MSTIFYSWQSDRPNKTNRSFIRDALDDAAKALKGSLGSEVEDAPRVDQDTQGIAGSPPIVDTILRKIDACDVFVPDVTFVAENEGRLVCNPNVMIEYGYALKSIGAERIVAVMNTAFGPKTDLPFDMRHRRHPIAYELSPDADGERRRAARSQLAARLQDAIQTVLATRSRPSAALPPPFPRAPSFDHGASFVESPSGKF